MNAIIGLRGKFSRMIQPKLSPLECLSIEETARRFNLEALLGEDTPKSRAELAFLSMLDGAFRQLAETHPSEHAGLFGRKDVVVADVGCGVMPYCTMLAYYFVAAGKQVTVVGIDDKEIWLFRAFFDSYEQEFKRLAPGASARFVTIPSMVEDSATHLRREGVKRLDLVTLFNQSNKKVYELLGALPTQSGSALLLTALNTAYGQKRFVRKLRQSKEPDTIGVTYAEMAKGLNRSGYTFLVQGLNPHIETIRSDFGRRYNPIIVAKRG